MKKPCKYIRGRIVTFNIYNKNYHLYLLQAMRARVGERRKFFDDDQFPSIFTYDQTGLLADRSTSPDRQIWQLSRLANPADRVARTRDRNELRSLGRAGSLGELLGSGEIIDHLPGS